MTVRALKQRSPRGTSNRLLGQAVQKVLSAEQASLQTPPDEKTQQMRA